MLERSWPAKDIAPLVLLIADPRHTVADDGTYKLSDTQARAILELRLARLTALGQDEISDELHKLGEEIKDYLDILGSRVRVMTIVTDELLAYKEEFDTPRRSEIVEAVGDFDDEDLIKVEDMVVTVTHTGYIKRVPLETYRAQRRGGKGRSGMQTKDEDFVTKLFVATTHTPIVFFSSRGIAYKMKVWRLPLSAPTARGKALINLLPLQKDEWITSIMPLPEDEETWGELDVVFATNRGTIRRNKLSDFTNVRQNGKIAMKLDETDEIVGVETCSEADDVLLTTQKGQAIRFKVSDARVFASRDSVGVRGIRLAKGDEVISLSILRHIDVDADERNAYLKLSRAVRGEYGEEGDAPEETDGSQDVGLSQERYAELGAAEQFILAVSENGYGKRSSSHEYRVTGRGGKGIVAMTTSDRNGDLVASFPVEFGDQIMLVTDGGQLIRCPIDGIRIAGRSTQGVTIFDTSGKSKVVSVSHISESDDEDGDDESGEGEETTQQE